MCTWVWKMCYFFNGLVTTDKVYRKYSTILPCAAAINLFPLLKRRRLIEIQRRHMNLHFNIYKFIGAISLEYLFRPFPTKIEHRSTTSCIDFRAFFKFDCLGQWKINSWSLELVNYSLLYLFTLFTQSNIQSMFMFQGDEINVDA